MSQENDGRIEDEPKNGEVLGAYNYLTSAIPK